MKNVLLKILGVAGAVCTVSYTNLQAQSTNSIDTSALRVSEQFSNQLTQFEIIMAGFTTNASIDAVMVAMETLKSTLSNLENVPANVDRQQQAKMWFDFLATIDKHTDTNFSQTNASISINVPPPSYNGVQYPAGVDPSVIKDPVARSQYESALKSNRELAWKIGFQKELEQINRRAGSDIERFLISHYSSSESDKGELDNIISKSKLSDAWMQRIRSIILRSSVINNP